MQHSNKWPWLSLIVLHCSCPLLCKSSARNSSHTALAPAVDRTVPGIAGSVQIWKVQPSWRGWGVRLRDGRSSIILDTHNWICKTSSTRQLKILKSSHNRPYLDFQLHILRLTHFFLFRYALPTLQTRSLTPGAQYTPLAATVTPYPKTQTLCVKTHTGVWTASVSPLGVTVIPWLLIQTPFALGRMSVR